MNRETIFSGDRIYRYVLWREWGPADNVLFPLAAPVNSNWPKYAMFIGLNPSTADETKDDPTIRKCVGFARRWGYGALCMTNLFAFQATLPKDMKKSDNPVGLHNQHHLLRLAADAGVVVAAWGVNGKHKHQDLTVQDWLSDIGVTLRCLRTTNGGHPEHPLYVPYDTQLIDL